MTRTMLIISSALSAVLVVLAFLLGGQIWPAALMLYAYPHHWTWVPPLGLFLAYGLIATGFLMGLKPVLLFMAALLSLANWDLAGLEMRLRLVDPEEDISRLERSHFLRLGLVLAAGAAGIWAALNLRLKLSFEWIAVLSVLGAWGLGRLIHRLLKEN
jgi:hypothetical protein